MKSFSDAMMRGVWGPHSKLENNLNYGGPDCAAEAPIEFKVAVIAIMIPYQLYVMRKGLKVKNSEFD